MTALEHFLLFVAAPVVLGLALLEGLVLSYAQGYDWRAFTVSVFDLICRIAVNLFIPISLAGPLVEWTVQHRLTTIHANEFGSGLLLFFGMEFCYYWYHRAAHRVRWFWVNHAIHHTPNALNLSAAIRIGIWGKFLGNAVFFVPLIWLGFDARTVFAVITLNLLYQFWIHATWIPKLVFLEGIINTPSAHRVHHAANLAYLDANYGGVLMVFDRLFGTYVAEREDLPCRYGLVEPIHSYNPLKIEWLPWLSLFKDLRQARNLRAFIGHLFMPPGWVADGEGSTTEELRARHKRLQQQA